VFGTAEKKENCYANVKVTRSAWDSNFIKANTKYFAVIWDSAGGGALAVIPHASSGKLAQGTLPLITGHKAAVNDIDFHPFNENLIASCAEDGYTLIWGIPNGGLTENLTEPLQTLRGHRRKVGTTDFNPVANNVLATSSTDFTVKIWDIEKGEEFFSTEGHTDIIQSVAWNGNGSLLATSCKDKKIRVLDPRANTVAQEAVAHQGVKGSRVVWLSNKEKVFSVGFTKTSEREYAIWDPRDLSKALVTQNIDSASGVIMPYYDPDTSMLYLAGKGDGNIRYYEIVDEAPYIYALSEFKSTVPTRGMAWMPKRALNVTECEIARALKLTGTTMEPISFKVPRKSDIFQDDIFPPTFSGEASLTAQEWKSGKNAEQKTVSLSGGFVPKETTTEFNPVQKQEEVLSEKELKELVEKLKNRVAFLEAEVVRKDGKIKELGGQP